MQRLDVDISDAPLIVHESLAAYGSQSNSGVRFAHVDSVPGSISVGSVIRDRVEQEHLEELSLSPAATRCAGAGNRARVEEPDPMRTAFQRDSDRIKHSTAFRRLAGKTQVVINAGEVNQHLRTRLTHAIEVEQVAVGIGGPLGLNTTFLSAAALAHDLGHGPAGHASEEAFSAYLPDGYDHAIYGADVVLAEMNVTDEIRDAVRCHSWRLPSPLTAEGTVVSWADRIAYVAHDWDDAVRGGIIDEAELPEQVRDFGGVRQSDQIGAFIGAIHECVERTGLLGMTQEGAAALEAFRKFNYERIYLRTASRVQAEKAIGLLRALVDYYIDAPGKVPGAYERGQMPRSGSMEATAAAVRYVSGMTDRLALDTGVQVLGYSPSALPRAV